MRASRASLLLAWIFLAVSGISSSASAQTGASCLPVEALTCQPDCDSGTVSLAWIPQGDYEGFEILRNGGPVAFLPGLQSQFVDLPPGPGSYDYLVQPVCLFGPPPPPSICTVDFCPPLPPQDHPFIRGDANSDGSVNLGDWIAILTFLFGGGSADCLDALDVNDDGNVNLGDAVFGLTYQFGGGVTISAPFLACGFDPTADAIGCAQPTSCPIQLEALTLPIDQVPLVFSQLDSFAVQLYDEFSGQPLPLVWIDDPILVNQFRDSVPLSGQGPGNLTHDATLRVELRTVFDDHYRIDIAEIQLGQPGLVMFEDGLGVCSELMQQTLGQAYGDPLFESFKEKAKHSSCDSSSSSPDCDWEEETLIPEIPGVWVWTDIKLIIYQDNEDKNWNQQYAQDHASAGANVETFEANGKNSIVNKLRQLQGQCKRVKTLVFAVHGSAGSIRIGPEGTPFRGPTRVGRHAGQTTAADFGAAIAPYLAPDSTIKLYSCSPAADGGTDATDGPQFIQDLADASGAKVEGSDEAVTIDGDQASTQGAVHTATPGGAAPVITTPAPAGDLDPC